MEIRTCLPDDLPRVLELTIDTFGPFLEDGFRPLAGETIFAIQHGRWREDYAGMVARLHDPADHHHVAIAWLDGVIAGFVGWYTEPARHKGYVEILAVDAAHRGAHIGTALCEHAFGRMRGDGAVVVEIGTGGDPFHAPARALYEKLGCIAVPVVVYLRELQ